MNELIFFIHIAFSATLVLIALRMGKEALIALFTLQMILSNLFVVKQMVLFGFNITCSEVYTISALFSLNLIQTYFGKKSGNQSLKIAFFLLVFVMLMSLFHLRYIPSFQDETHTAFKTILENTPRIALTSIFCTIAMQKLDMTLFGLFKKRLPKLPFFIPFVCSALLTQLIDTILFSFIALYGIVHSMRDIIVISYLVKIVAIFSIIPSTFLVKKWMRHDPVQV